jgi:hypothetical protein
MRLINPLSGLLIVAMISAVPSNTAFHPLRAQALGDLAEEDISGSGREAPEPDRARQASERDETAAKTGRYWRAMAQRCRSLATWQNQDARAVLLRLAEEYEERARAADRPRCDDQDA